MATDESSLFTPEQSKVTLTAKRNSNHGRNPDDGEAGEEPFKKQNQQDLKFSEKNSTLKKRKRDRVTFMEKEEQITGPAKKKLKEVYSGGVINEAASVSKILKRSLHSNSEATELIRRDNGNLKVKAKSQGISALLPPAKKLKLEPKQEPEVQEKSKKDPQYQCQGPELQKKLDNCKAEIEKLTSDLGKRNDQMRKLRAQLKSSQQKQKSESEEKARNRKEVLTDANAVTDSVEIKGTDKILGPNQLLIEQTQKYQHLRNDYTEQVKTNHQLMIQLTTIKFQLQDLQKANQRYETICNKLNERIRNLTEESEGLKERHSNLVSDVAEQNMKSMNYYK